MSLPPPGQWPPPPPGPAPSQPPWSRQSNAAPRRGSGGKWLLAGLALLAVVVVSVVATLLFTRDGSAPPAASAPVSPSADTSNIASANDRKPAGIILDDPTCESWSPISAAFGTASDAGWGNRDPAIPESNWSPDQRNQYAAISAALSDAADRAVVLARQTPHRVMREIYEQFIAYSREYVSKLDKYTEPDDLYVRVSISTSMALDGICGAIQYGAAGARSPLVPSAAPSTVFAKVEDPEDAGFFLTSTNPVCPKWLSAVDKFTADTAAWRSIDPNIPASDLSAEQRAINAGVMPVMESFATESQMLGRESENSIWADLATLSAQYRRAYVSALLTYTVADDYLQLAAASAAGTISGACRVVGP